MTCISLLSEAFQQIDSTITRFKNKLQNYDIRPRVIIKKVNTHSINSSEYRNFKKKYPAVLCKSGEFKEPV